MPDYFSHTDLSEVQDMHLVHDDVRNLTVGMFLLKSGELKSYFLEKNFSQATRNRTSIPEPQNNQTKNKTQQSEDITAMTTFQKVIANITWHS